ncbi:aldehyde dehydrogenase family protein [Calidifontibacter sp. DB0510]|uniref:aldehyde dehydrogenase (NAD(+)) n=1 Tax=Metallococcus carri TaxID=1656884 RepID=A0A967AYH3_9MICO|nr:aldehyde dehydrogenase family protein [Metallococcus carri]NHN54757.1 aldehyde dehydrogenase family protein [Metallococcus carri]NOP37102.1 aldehyde dehydrogenase family protein [Calidifontibacter sp. DB2511S]
MTTAHVTSFVDGEWTAPTGHRADVVSPHTEDVIAEVELADADTARSAVAAAVRDQPAWAATPPSVRAALVERMATLVQEREDELTELITAEVGMPAAQARVLQVQSAIGALQDAARLLRQALAPETIGDTVVVHEPAGVVVGITPWNFPLYQAALKVGPALAAGCAIVLKPSEVTPLTAIVLAEVFADARTALGRCGHDVPTGICSVVLGDADIGAVLAADHRIDLVSLTGSTSAGRAVAAAASGTVTRVSLELGGKSPLVVLPDADLEEAVRYGVARCFVNSGQTCAALTRLIVPRDRLAEVERIAADAVAEVRLGETLGPLVSRTQRDRVLAFIDRGLAEGARLVAGGSDRPRERGWFVRPTVFSDTRPEMTIVREEIFGPVLVLQAYDSVAEAVQLANDTDYGLAAGVIGGDPKAEREVASQLRAGMVFLGAVPTNPQAPFGGVKHSGYGRERGRHGISEYLVPKALVGAAKDRS